MTTIPTTSGKDPMTPTPMCCPQCQAPVTALDRFCESCGHPLLQKRFGTSSVRGAGPAAPCPSCGGAGSDQAGYCSTCGTRLPDGTEHYAADLGAAVVISDIGLVHAHNEDGVAAAVVADDTGLRVAAVVCDGISTVLRPEDASMAAADAAVSVIISELMVGTPPKQTLLGAAAASAKAVAALARPRETEPPACTFVAATVIAPAAGAATVGVGWIGDSRAYWLSRGFGRSARLTEDDSWAGEMVRSGRLDEATAMASPKAHAITRWIGADTADDPDAVRPHLVEFSPDGPGVLLLCSDGLWNYLGDPGQLAQLVFATDTLDLPSAARRLVELALAGGGDDNIAVVLVDLTAAAAGGKPAAVASEAPTVVLPVVGTASGTSEGTPQ